MNEQSEIERRVAFLMGQVSVLGMALQAALMHHPRRTEVALSIHENYEKAVSRVLPRGFPEAFLDGMKTARDLYLLKDQEDRGQPKL